MEKESHILGNDKEKIKRKKKDEQAGNNRKRQKRETAQGRRNGFRSCGSDVQVLIASFVGPVHLVTVVGLTSRFCRAGSGKSDPREQGQINNSSESRAEKATFEEWRLLENL